MFSYICFECVKDLQTTATGAEFYWKRGEGHGMHRGSCWVWGVSRSTFSRDSWSTAARVLFSSLWTELRSCSALHQHYAFYNHPKTTGNHQKLVFCVSPKIKKSLTSNFMVVFCLVAMKEQTQVWLWFAKWQRITYCFGTFLSPKSKIINLTFCNGTMVS